MPKVNIKHDYMLWGLKKAPKNKIDEVYGTEEKPKLTDIPDKIDNEVIDKIKDEQPKKEEFKLKKLNEYTSNDIEYLEEEYNKLDAVVDAMEASNPKVDEIINLQNDLYEIIEQLKYKREQEDKPKDIVELDWDKINKLNEISELNRIKYIESKGTDLNAKKKWEDADKEIAKLYKMAGRGFKKNSPEAFEHAKKMAEARKAKTQPKPKEEVKQTKSTKSPKPKRLYYQFKPIPNGYRGANEDEAILANKVGKYGLFVVNPDKIKYYEEYDYLLSENLPIINVRGYIHGLKKKIKRALEDIEIAKSRLDNNPDSVKHKNDLEDAKYNKSLFVKFYKWYCKKYNIPYIKIELEKKVISDGKLKENIIIPKYDEYFKKPEDIRKPKEQKEQEKQEYVFEKNGIFIRLNIKYFTNGKLKSSYAKKLYDRNILLDSIYYTEADKKKYFYSTKGSIGYGIGGKLKFKLSTISNKLNPVNWVGKSGRKGMIQLGQLTHDEILPAVVEYGKPIYEEAVRYGATALTGNPELGDLASKTLWDKMGKKYDPRKYANQINITPQEIENAKRKPKERLQRIGFSRFT